MFQCFCSCLFIILWSSNGRNDTSNVSTVDVLPLPDGQDKSSSAGAIVKSGSEKGKTTPAGEYLTAALTEFDPDQFESFAAIADGANKLLMLVYF